MLRASLHALGLPRRRWPRALAPHTSALFSLCAFLKTHSAVIGAETRRDRAVTAEGSTASMEKGLVASVARLMGWRRLARSSAHIVGAAGRPLAVQLAAWQTAGQTDRLADGSVMQIRLQLALMIKRTHAHAERTEQCQLGARAARRSQGGPPMSADPV